MKPIGLNALAKQYGYDESTVRQWRDKGMPYGENSTEAETRSWIVVIQVPLGQLMEVLLNMVGGS
ncbi:hypothetical protein [Cedecea lapagei]|uniref:hypothetical protein n=1 Tax=Cedecea lapagei TaxID=158823 RepID=UPI000F8328AA|nr:hypothetical protein [Cedecea lapagei]